jgi:NodT family efflux transporter outer membrane factor (OMF) lipoprotein
MVSGAVLLRGDETTVRLAGSETGNREVLQMSKREGTVRWGGMGGAVALALLLGACADGMQSPYQVNRDFTVPARWQAFATSEPRLHDSGWVASFQSPMLDQLVSEAMVNNRDLRAAAARLAEARAVARQAGLSGWPDVSAGLTGTRTGNGDVTSFVDVTMRVAWEADLWGRIQGERLAAGYEAVAQEAIFEAARQSLAAAVAEAWITANGHAREAEIARQELGVRQALLNNIEERVAAQAVLAVEANWARADVDRARDRLAAAEGEVANAIRVVEVLVGRYPAGTLDVVTGLPSLPGRVSAGLPAQMLERRPDIIAAERRVAAAFHRQTASQAARLPRISLSTDFTGTGGSLGSALDAGGIVWTLVGNIITPLIDGARLEEEVNIATARQEEALALYGAAALTAFREVETALADEEVLRRRLGLLNSAAGQLELAVTSERERFDAGETEQFRLDEARVRYYAALRDANAVRVAVLQNRVRLHLALGGSFVRYVTAEEAAAAALGQ